MDPHDVDSHGADLDALPHEASSDEAQAPPRDIPRLEGRVWFLTGATASGKTAAGLLLAEQLGGEILSLDSMALYRRLDIGTAKPTIAERARAPHHLIDVIEPHQDFNLADYILAAHQAVQEVRARGRQPIFVGGTPLYLKALLRGLFTGPPADWEFRKRLAQMPADQLHARLAAVDPAAGARLHPNDARRLIRALEVFEKTGRPISAWQQQFDRARPASELRVFVLDWEPEALRERIDQRVDAMFAAGLVDEVRSLLAAGAGLSRTARQAVGYREVIEHLEGGADLPTTIERVKFATHRFARKQRTWFRSLGECQWIPMHAGMTPAAVVAQLVARGG